MKTPSRQSPNFLNVNRLPRSSAWISLRATGFLLCGGGLRELGPRPVLSHLLARDGADAALGLDGLEDAAHRAGDAALGRHGLDRALDRGLAGGDLHAPAGDVVAVQLLDHVEG